MPPASPRAPAAAELPPPGVADVLYLVDLSGYVFRAYHALPPLSSSRGEPTHAVLGTVNMLQKVVAERRPRMFAVAMDSKGPTFRHAVDVRYKATRPAPPEDLSQQMARVEEIIRAWDVACFRKEGLEADDLIAAVTDRALREGLRVVIVSADKDLMQLVHDSDDLVVLWDSMRDRVYGHVGVREKFGVGPSQVRDYLALTGDTSDNVPGVPGVGPKTASDLLLQFGTLEGIYAGLDRVAKPKLRESLRAHETDARISQKLVTLDRTASVEWDEGRLRWGGADHAALRGLYTELEFSRQLRELDALAAAAAERRPGSGAPPSGWAAAGASTAFARGAACVLDAVALAAVVAEAFTRGRLAVGVEATGPEATHADVLGLSLAVSPEAGHYVPIGHRYLGCPAQLTWAEVARALGPALGSRDVLKVSHDQKRVAILLERLGTPIRGPAFDTLIAAYLLDPEAPNELKDLARRELAVTRKRDQEPVPLAGKAPKGKAAPVPFDQVDVERATQLSADEAPLALALYERLAPRLETDRLLSLFRDLEMPLERVLGDMEMRGVLVDFAALRELGREVEQNLRDIEAECKRLAGRDFTLRSRDQLESLLFDELALPVVKRTPKGGRSTDADVLEALADKHPLAAKVLEFRELDKLKGTYIDALPRAVSARTGRIHTRFDQAVAATGRLSSSEPNLQNIPIRTELGRKIRQAFVAPPGHVILSADYSQIELRILAHLSGDPELVDAFTSGQDVHVRTAALIFDKGRDQVTVDERRAAKTINFGVIYGMGESALAKQLGISRDEAARFIAAYFTRYAGVARFMEQVVDSARQGEAVRTLLGRRRYLPNLHSANRALRFEAERIARNTPIQGTAADILKRAMVTVGEGGGAERMVLTVHDELVFEVPEGEVERSAAHVRERMAGAMKLAVPLVVDVGWGASWALAH